MPAEAPYVETDKRMLGDSHLNPEESVIRERESLLKKAGQYRIYGQEELEKPERAFGPRLQYTELISRLKRIAPELKARDGSEGNIALYYPRTAEDYAETMREWSEPSKDDHFFQSHRYVIGFPKQEIPEYGSVDIDTSLLPTREGWKNETGKFIQGHSWRSVLITLIKAGVISFSDAVQEFGDVGTDKRGWRWNEQLHPWRVAAGNKFRNEIQERQ